jgi:hypothetical protein
MTYADGNPDPDLEQAYKCGFYCFLFDHFIVKSVLAQFFSREYFKKYYILHMIEIIDTCAHHVLDPMSIKHINYDAFTWPARSK